MELKWTGPGFPATELALGEQIVVAAMGTGDGNRPRREQSTSTSFKGVLVLRPALLADAHHAPDGPTEGMLVKQGFSVRIPRYVLRVAGAKALWQRSPI
jgi:hypothetical protein